MAFDKNLLALGPAGGSGGRGGDVYLEAIPSLEALYHYRSKKDWQAEHGRDGRGQFVDGPTGKDLILKVPVGTVVHNLTAKTETELVKIGEKILIARGGLGGKGNFHFRSPKNTSPKQFQPGLPGETFELRLELKLIADVGLIGLPNVGKSSLLNELTNAKSKVADYFFTTLEPNLGVYYELIIADIPGLIEGASVGKGLGIKFLRHIERTNILFHLIGANSEDVAKDYKIIRQELGKHSKELLRKDEYVFLNKTDLIEQKELEKKIKILKKLNPRVIPLSNYDDNSLEEVRKILNEIKAKKII